MVYMVRGGKDVIPGCDICIVLGGECLVADIFYKRKIWWCGTSIILVHTYKFCKRRKYVPLFYIVLCLFYYLSVLNLINLDQYNQYIFKSSFSETTESICIVR